VESDLALIGLVLGAAAAGLLVARASVELPAESGAPRPSPTRRRYLLCTGACVFVALWSAIVTPNALAVVGAALGVQLVLIAILDAEHLWLPHRLTVPLGLMGLAEAAALQPDELIDRLIGAAVGFAVLAAIAFVYRRLRGREGIGGGDFRLLAAAGAWVGWIGLPSVLVLGCLVGLVLAMVRAIRTRTLESGLEVPFGVYLAIGLWLTWLYGPVGLQAL